MRVVSSDVTWPHAQIINYPRDPGPFKYLFSMWAFGERDFFDILEEYCDFVDDYDAKTGFRIYVVGSRGGTGRSVPHPRGMEEFL